MGLAGTPRVASLARAARLTDCSCQGQVAQSPR
eukprot:COSAG02_NODE_67164_length_253_cov_1.324675_1_plen_32_part_01